MDSLVSGQRYLWTPFQIPVLPASQTLYLGTGQKVQVAGGGGAVGRSMGKKEGSKSLDPPPFMGIKSADPPPGSG